MSASLAETQYELQAAAIQQANRCAAELVRFSESLRETIDHMETALLVVSGTDCKVSPAIASKLFERLQQIRKCRNTMESFEFECRVKAAMEKAWEALP